MCAHVMFGLPPVSASQHARAGFPFLLGEFIASFGLLAVIESATRRRPGAVVAAVAAWIGAAYWCTASTSFANPAVTIARSLGDTFTGIRPLDVPGFIVAQIAGGAAAVWVMQRLVLDQRAAFAGATPCRRRTSRRLPSCTTGPGRRATRTVRSPRVRRDGACTERQSRLLRTATALATRPASAAGRARTGGTTVRWIAAPTIEEWATRDVAAGVVDVRAGAIGRAGGQRPGAGDRGGFRPPPAESPRPEPPNRTEPPQRGESSILPVPPRARVKARALRPSHEHDPLRMRAQCRPVADGGGVLQRAIGSGRRTGDLRGNAAG